MIAHTTMISDLAFAFILSFELAVGMAWLGSGLPRIEEVALAWLCVVATLVAMVAMVFAAQLTLHWDAPPLTRMQRVNTACTQTEPGTRAVKVKPTYPSFEAFALRANPEWGANVAPVRWGPMRRTVLRCYHAN